MLAAKILMTGLLSTLSSWLMTRALLPFLKKLQLMDLPNERSNHHMPTPRGGGIAIISTIILGWLGVLWLNIPVPSSLIIAAIISGLLLAIISLKDDIHPVSPKWRLCVQLVAVSLTLLILPKSCLLFQGMLPFFLDRLLTLFAWIWFINLYNFMDGIDGISASQTFCITLAISMLAAYGIVSTSLAFLAIIIAGAALGFLFWNWQPAKLFMGDIGSIPLGYYVGFLLLLTAYEGYWYISLIISSYYLADSSLTLLKRVIRGKSPFKAHSEHFYQKAVKKGWSHQKIVLTIICTNLLLFTLSLFPLFFPTPLHITLALGTAMLVVGITLYWFQR